MSIGVHLDKSPCEQPRRVLHFTLDAAWTWEEFYVAVHQAENLIDTSPDIEMPIPAIIDMRTTAARLPDAPFSHVLDISQRAHGNLSPIIVVGAGKIWQALNKVLRGLGNPIAQEAIFVATLDDAHKIIRQRHARH